MKDKRTDSKERLLHIQKAILDIERFLCHTDEQEFLENELLHNAVLMQFIIIGEAIAHVDNDILKRYEYSWYKVRAFRNFIAQEYFNIKLSAVWGVIKSDMNSLKEIIDKLLQSEFNT